MTRLHCEPKGPDGAPPLLLGGSLGTTLKMWSGQLGLAERFRIVPFDHRGHGRSPVPPGPYEIADLGRDVLETMDALGIARAHYCGLSIGGMVGMWLGANAPERIDRMILICTAAHLPPRSAWEERIRAVTKADSAAVVADAVVDRWLTPAYAAAQPAIREKLRAMLAESPPDGYAACCEAIARMDLRDSLAAIHAPTLVISGAQDQAAPVVHQELIAAAIPAARHEVLAPGAHVVVVERADAVNRLIMEHLR